MAYKIWSDEQVADYELNKNFVETILDNLRNYVAIKKLSISGGNILFNDADKFVSTPPYGNTNLQRFTNLNTESTIVNSGCGFYYNANGTTNGSSLYYVGKNYDWFDSSFDTAKWTAISGTAVENGSAFFVYASGTNTTNGFSAVVHASGTGNKWNVYPAAGSITDVFFRSILKAVSTTTPTGGSQNINRLYVYDTAGNSVLLVNKTTGADTMNTDLPQRFVFNTTTGSVQIFSGLTIFAEEISLGSLTGSNWFFRWWTHAGQTASSQDKVASITMFNPIYSNGGGNDAASFESNTSTLESSGSKSVPYIYSFGNTAGVGSILTSTNSGTNYTVTPSGTLTNLTNAGSVLRVKIVPPTSGNFLCTFADVGVRVL